MQIFFILLSIAILIAILFYNFKKSDKSIKLDREEIQLIDRLGFDKKIANEIKSYGTAIKPLLGQDEHDEEIAVDGFALWVESSKGGEALKKIRAYLIDTSYQAYYFDYNFGMSLPDSIAIVKTKDPYKYMSMIGIKAVNHGLETKDIMKQIKVWDKEFGLEVVAAGLDHYEAKFKKLPSDMIAFAKEVYDFCPDAVDQGPGDIEGLAKEMTEKNSLYLWWD